MSMDGRHPRATFITIYGRKPVLEALETGVAVAKVHLADNAGGDVVDRLLAAARTRGVQVQRA